MHILTLVQTKNQIKLYFYGCFFINQSLNPATRYVATFIFMSQGCGPCTTIADSRPTRYTKPPEPPSTTVLLQTTPTGES